MLCFVCLIENREPPCKAVTHIAGSAVCKEHVGAVGNADMLSLTYRLRGIGERLKERNAHANGRSKS